MNNFSSRLPPRRTVIQIVSISVIVIAVVLIALASYVYYQAVKTFEVRRVSLPTRVYTDMYSLRAGSNLAPGHLTEKLQRLGYREVKKVERAGDYSGGGDQLTIFLRPFKHPSGERKSEAVTVRFARNAIEAVAGPDGNNIETAALEPELMTSILSDQLENRRPVTRDQVPQHLVDAVVVTEDVRFFQHPGVDPVGIFRALFKNIRAKGVTEGGSTLTQQLVKNYYLTSERTMRRKVVEAFMSLILDAKYSKNEILEAYLNDIYLGRNRSISILGVGEAARFYFGKPVSEISIAEAALLAGMVRSPNNNSPFVNPEKARTRRKTVLELLLRNKKIDKAQFEAALKVELPKRPSRERSGLTSIPFYVDRVLQELSRDYGIADVKGRGLSIYTAIDLDLQDSATRTLQDGVAGLEKTSKRLRRSDSPLQGAMLAVDVPTGEIRALVGGRNYDRSQFNRIISAKRQVGSLFKPFVFLTAFEPSLSRQNITPATLVNDTRFVLDRKYGKDWSPRNYNEAYMGVVTVRRALEQSLNVASVRLGLSAGVDQVIKTARALGVETELENVPSLILGSVEIPPIEMAEAYTTIARMGSRIPLRAVRFVTDDRGNVIAAAEKTEGVQVFPARDVYLAVHLMEGVVDRGTAASSRSLGFTKSAAGKTGTTNDKRDAWFIGFTPQTLALTWLGFDDNSPVGLSGSEGAVPVWTSFMKIATSGEPDREFPVPGGISFAVIDALSGGLGTTLCPANMVVNEAFKTGTEPLGVCQLHSPQLVLTPTDPNAMYPEGSFPTDTIGTLPGTAIPSPGATAKPSPSNNPPPLSGGAFRTETAQPAPPPPRETPAPIPPPTTTVAPPPQQPETVPTVPPPTSTDTVGDSAGR